MQLGFWRVVLDEAQQVENDTSRAALMCSMLQRRHAWVMTGTPITRSYKEVARARGRGRVAACRG